MFLCVGLPLNCQTLESIGSVVAKYLESFNLTLSSQTRSRVIFIPSIHGDLTFYTSIHSIHPRRTDIIQYHSFHPSTENLHFTVPFILFIHGELKFYFIPSIHGKLTSYSTIHSIHPRRPYILQFYSFHSSTENLHCTLPYI